MKIEMDSDTAMALVVITIVICLTAGALGVCHESETTNRKAIDAGLVQKPTANTERIHWEKP